MVEFAPGLKADPGVSTEVVVSEGATQGGETRVLDAGAPDDGACETS